MQQATFVTQTWSAPTVAPYIGSVSYPGERSTLTHTQSGCRMFTDEPVFHPLTHTPLLTLTMCQQATLSQAGPPLPRDHPSTFPLAKDLQSPGTTCILEGDLGCD